MSHFHLAEFPLQARVYGPGLPYLHEGPTPLRCRDQADRRHRTDPIDHKHGEARAQEQKELDVPGERQRKGIRFSRIKSCLPTMRRGLLPARSDAC